MTAIKIKTVIVSVSDKSDLLEFVQGLNQFEPKILSTGGTAELLSTNGIDVVEVSEHTGFPEMMGGRVKTLHPKIHGGLLGRSEIDEEVMTDAGIAPSDLLVSNLYPFEEAIAKPDATFADAIENIDIGGPAMVRSAAKNFSRVTVIVDPSDYAWVLQELQDNDGAISQTSRYRLAVKAFSAIARYDAAIANYLSSIDDDGAANDFPATLTLQFERKQAMRYGENPHQSAAFYVERNPQAGSVSSATQVQGKALSYNNVADTDAAIECVRAFSEPACVIVKHANPCGVAVAGDIAQAYELAFATDPTSAFGGIIAFNRPLTVSVAQTIVEKQFVEVIVAPSFEEGVNEVVAKKKNVRLLDCAALGARSAAFEYKRVDGGLLVQDRDELLIDEAALRVVTSRAPTEEEHHDLMFAWTVAKYVKSNAIVYAKNRQTIGVGAGQMSRVYSAKVASLKAGDEGLIVAGSVMASDAFFPFRDGIDAAAEVGIKAVIQPGGSVRDEEVIAAADEAGMAMIFTGMRHFRH